MTKSESQQPITRVSPQQVAATVDHKFMGNRLTEQEKHMLVQRHWAFDIVDAQQHESKFEVKEESHSTGYFWTFWIELKPGLVRVLAMDEKRETAELYAAIHQVCVAQQLRSGPWVLQYVEPKVGLPFFSLVPFGGTLEAELGESS